MSQILAIFRVPSLTKEQYDNVIQALEQAGKATVKERPYHLMGTGNSGGVVVETWESQEALNEFFGTLGPILAQNGVNPPPPEIYEVHNTIS